MPTKTSTKASPDNPGVTARLCQWIHDLKLSDVPPDVIARAKHIMLDGIGCALVSSHLPWSEIAAKGVFSMEGEGPCTVIGWGDKKLGPLAAAILNSTFTQGFELDDYHAKAPVHSASLMTPALLAAAELLASSDDPDARRALSGEAILKAFIIGCEVGPRVGLALHGPELLSRGWHSGAIQGPSAAGAGVSSLLGLKPEQTEWALGMSATQAGGLMSAQFGSMAKRMQHGFASRNGLFGALMAKQGYTGIESVYELEYGGFFSVFGQGSTSEPKTLPEELVRTLGKEWEIENIRIKLHAAMAGLHTSIDCVARLQEELPTLFTAENLVNIESIVSEHGKAAYEHGGWLLPEDKPFTSTGAQMSIQYATAAQLLDGEVLMSQYGAKKLDRPELRELTKKIKPTYNAALEELGATFRTIMTVRFKDGTEVKSDVEAPKGVKPPLTNEDIVEKWRHLTADTLGNERRAAIEKSVLGLESMDDIRELTGLLGETVNCPIDVVTEA